jgi:hypothetical protein
MVEAMMILMAMMITKWKKLVKRLRKSRRSKSTLYLAHHQLDPSAKGHIKVLPAKQVLDSYADSCLDDELPSPVVKTITYILSIFSSAEMKKPILNHIANAHTIQHGNDEE